MEKILLSTLSELAKMLLNTQFFKPAKWPGVFKKTRETAGYIFIKTFVPADKTTSVIYPGGITKYRGALSIPYVLKSVTCLLGCNTIKGTLLDEQRQLLIFNKEGNL